MVDVVQVAAAPRQRDLYDAAWDLFTSVKIAIAIIVLLAAFTLVGTLLIQPVQTVDERLLTDPSQRLAFLEFAQLRYGFLAGALAPPELRDLTVGLMYLIGLFDVFNAPWFRALLVVLAVSVIMCTLNRLEPVWRTLRQPIVRRDPLHYESARNRRVLAALDPATAARALRAWRYRVLVQRDPDGTAYLLGDRHAWARLGTLASHSALLLLILSGAVGSLFNFRVDIAIPDLGSKPVFGVGTVNNITVRSERFVATFREDGTPSDFYTDVVLIQNGGEVKRHRVRVNDPLRYGGLTFHQLSFGKAVDLEIRDARSGHVLLSEVVPFVDEIGGVPFEFRQIPNRDERLFLALPPRDTPFLALQLLRGDAPVANATLEVGDEARVGDYQLVFRRPTQYTVIRVARNSGEALLWVAAALFIGGVLATFWWPRRRVWLRLRASDTVLTGTADRTFDIESELDRLAKELPVWTR